MKLIQTKEEETNTIHPKIIDIFRQYLIGNMTQKSYYFLNNMIDQNLIDSSITKNIRKVYFSHYKTIEECKTHCFDDPFYSSFLVNIEELSNNDWEHHK